MTEELKDAVEVGMTPEESREWFNFNARFIPQSTYLGVGPDTKTTFWEQMYQAFYARMLQDFKRDATCNCLVNIPTLDKQPDEK